MKEVTIEKTFCTTRQAANLLGVSVGTVQAWVERGLLRAWKTAGGHRRVLRASVAQLLSKNTPNQVGAHADVLPHAGAMLAPRSGALRVMVVDDDKDLLRLYKSQLTGWSMAPVVSLANSGFNSLLRIGRSHPDLLIVDLNMPGINGFTMLWYLSQTPEMRCTKMVAVTGLDAAQVQRSGGVPLGIEVLPKPVPFGRLKTIAIELAGNLALLREEQYDAPAT